MTDHSRVNFEATIKTNTIQALARDSRLEVLQTSDPIPDRVWSLLNEILFAVRPDVQLRVYGHYGSVCDLNLVRRMPNVRHFAADCLTQAKNAYAITSMSNLESLSLGVFELQEFDFLESIPTSITSLSLGQTRSKRLNLASLSHLISLRSLRLNGQNKSIEVLSGLNKLEDITLRSVTTPHLSYLTPLEHLWSLDIKLGGIRSFAGIEGKDSIKYLEICQVRELRNVDIITDLPGLQNLFLQSLPHLASIPMLNNARKLRRVELQNLRGLSDFSGLENAPSLEQFRLIEGDKQSPEQLLPILRNPSVRYVSAGFGSDRKNEQFDQLRTEYGKAPWDTGEDFTYK